MPKWRRDSIFGGGPRRPLDRNQRARFDYLLNAHHRAGRLTRAARDVGRALLRRLGVDGRCDPSHATLADDADCCERTVERACGAMRAIGLLFWQRRLVRDGSRVDQTSNAYTLNPSSTAEPVERLRDRHSGGGTLKEGIVSAPAAAVRAVKGVVKRVVEALASAPGDTRTLREIRELRQQALGKARRETIAARGWR